MKLVLFDVDGTLIQISTVDDECFERAFRDEFGIPSVDTDWASYEICTDSSIVPEILRSRLGRDPTKDEVDRHRHRFSELLKEAWRRNPLEYTQTPGARELLRALRSDPRWRVAVATGGWSETARFKLRSAGLDVSGIPFASADDHWTREGILRIAIAAARLQNGRADFETIVLVGDGSWDVRSARALEIAFVGIGDEAAAGNLRAEGASAVVRDFRDIDAFFASLERAEPPRGDWPP
jgi:phosphoglycolate phosphatase-like HAD superfamily hydrolase